MTALHFCTIACDFADCGEEVGWEPSISAARRVAREAGWKYRAGTDFCPEHAALSQSHETPKGTQ